MVVGSGLLFIRPSVHPPPSLPCYSAALPPLSQSPKLLTGRARFRAKSQQRNNGRDGACPDPQTRRSPFASIPRLIERFRGDEISLQVLTIGLPAMLALAADPIASLVDTAFVGHLGTVELAAVGVSVSVFNLVSKLFNVPLLNVTTSFVAEQQALECSTVNEDETSNYFGILYCEPALLCLRICGRQTQILACVQERKLSEEIHRTQIL